MNASITYASPGFQFTSVGPISACFVHIPVSITIVYADTGTGIHTDTISPSPALVVNVDGTPSENIIINRVTNSWLLCAVKGTTQLLVVQEYLFTTLDSMFGGDQNYAILGRVLHHQILPFQNV